MGELPTGTVTFLFTDIEGSTRLLQELGGEYADVLAEHRRLLRDAFTRHGGVEVDTQGDAFFVAFVRASDALAAAREAQAALGDGSVRVRIGVHTGEPLLTEEGYVGIDVHRAARIAAVGHGGQVLVSQSTRDLAGADSLRDLGEHRLKDLTAAERVYQLGDADFPPLKSLNATNLPVASSSLVGRRRELEEITALLADSGRLVTLTGPGGTGKTRLALQAAAELIEDFSGGVFFVPLSGVEQPELVPATITSTLGIRQLRELHGRQTLLLLDNFEHLLGAAPTVADILRSASNTKVLATSRAPLRIEGEREYPVDPLPDDDAVALLTERARAVRPDFVPDDATLESAAASTVYRSRSSLQLRGSARSDPRPCSSGSSNVCRSSRRAVATCRSGNGRCVRRSSGATTSWSRSYNGCSRGSVSSRRSRSTVPSVSPTLVSTASTRSSRRAC
jgi:class 3 adenylate cyclase